VSAQPINGPLPRGEGWGWIGRVHALSLWERDGLLSATTHPPTANPGEGGVRGGIESAGWGRSSEWKIEPSGEVKLNSRKEKINKI